MLGNRHVLTGFAELGCKKPPSEGKLVSNAIKTFFKATGGNADKALGWNSGDFGLKATCEKYPYQYISILSTFVIIYSFLLSGGGRESKKLKRGFF